MACNRFNASTNKHLLSGRAESRPFCSANVKVFFPTIDFLFSLFESRLIPPTLNLKLFHQLSTNNQFTLLDNRLNASKNKQNLTVTSALPC